MNPNLQAIRILAFGDSNTWGRVPGDDNTKRFPLNKRWPGILQTLLGNDYEVIEEGLNGRTTDIDSPHKMGKNGLQYLYPCLETHKPLDFVILSLGKNDLKAKYHRGPHDIAQGLEHCLQVILKEGKDARNKVPQIIILSTGIIEEKARLRFGKKEVDFLGGKEKSQKLV